MWGATLNEGRDRSPGDSCLILMLRWVLPPLNEGRDRSPRRQARPRLAASRFWIAQ